MARITAFSDVHKLLSHRDKSEINARIKGEGTDLVITLGDIPFEALRDIAEIASETGIQTLSVRGNHDGDYSLESIPEVIDLHGNLIEIDGIRFAGLEGCLKYQRAGRKLGYDDRGHVFDPEDYDKERDYSFLINHFYELSGRRKFIGTPDAHVFLSHFPSIGGFGIVHSPPKTFKEYLRTQPTLKTAFHGHVHQDYSLRVLNPQGNVIEIIGVYTPANSGNLGSYGKIVDLNLKALKQTG